MEKEDVLKELIKQCKIDDLRDLTLMIFTKESSAVDITKLFKSQTKELLEKSLVTWENMLLEMENQFISSKELSDQLTEQNQNEMIENLFTFKECRYIHYKIILTIQYYKDCVNIMKKIIKNK